MRAAILSIGDELVLGQCVDTNSAWLAEQLMARSTPTVEHRTVGDDQSLIAEAITQMAQRCELLILTGGLGPTEDDLTRQALGDVLTPGRALVTDDAALKVVRRWFAGRHMPEGNLIQAQRPESMRMLSNPRGTAPGLAGEHEGCAIYALPGPPREMRPMFERFIVGELPAVDDEHRMLTEKVLCYGLGESRAAELLGELTSRDQGTVVGITASQGIISARIRAGGPTAEQDLEDAAEIVENAWAPYCFGRGDAVLPEVVGDMLRAAGRTLVTAESCTGGWLGKLLVDIAGSSDYYRGGWVTYADAMKHSCLGVPEALLKAHGAVSEPVAKSMAEGALWRGAADYSLATTGIAGPGGDVPGKPVGTVFIALCSRKDGESATFVRRFRFPGERAVVRDRSTKSALQMLRLALLGEADDRPLLWEDSEASVRQVDGV